MMRCLVVDYSDDQDNTVNVVVRGVSLAGLPLTVNGDGLLQDVHRSGFYSIRYGFGVPFQGTLTTIIDTDYDDYAVVYSCTNSLLSGVFHSEYIWVLSRSGKISNPTRQNIYEKLDKLNINRSGLTMSDRSTCPTNSSTVARESDKDLAGALASGAAQPLPAGAAAAGSAADAKPAAEGSSSASASSSGATLEKVAPVESQKFVPLLYDQPSPVSSSSVGGNKAGASAKSPAAAPVADSKAPLGAPIVKPVAAAKPALATAAVAAAPVVQPQQASPAAVGQQKQSQQQVQPPQQAQPQPQAQQQQQPQQQQPPQSLMAKIQQKP